MNYAAALPLEGKPMTTDDIFAAVTALLPRLAEARDECDELGRMPDDICEALREAGAFRIAFPKTMGGPEMTLLDQTRLIEKIARANPSVGWNIMILADSGYFAGMFEPALARAFWPRLDMATSAVSRPPAKAEPIPGGYRISGRLGFASGVRNADRVSIYCHLYRDGQPELGPDGKPALYNAFLPAEAFTIHDAWDTIGMRGTGSTQISVEGFDVPAAHFHANRDHTALSVPPLSRYETLMFANQLGVILGTTRAILEDAEARLEKKLTPALTPLVDEYRFKVGVPHAWGLWEAAKSYAYEVIGQADDLIFADQPVGPDVMARVISMTVMAPELCRRAADEMLELLGSDPIFRSVGLERLYADLRVGSTHIISRKETLARVPALWAEARASGRPAHQV